MSKHVTKGKLEMVELGEERGRIQIKKILPDKIPVLAVFGEDIKSGTKGDFLFWRGNQEFYFMKIWRLGPRTSEHERSYEKSAVNRYSGILNTKKSEEILRRKGSIMIRLGGVKNSKLEGCF
ncbi:hypothetical protein HZH66_014659 [Vespula vulgaris]|uniref:Uncharacterized protein n=1 Tax=Vespula vulgaris TaxID=7454 RepID=A0A834J1W9_VESVU|nr:hypothetical protein HZH66_014659 [Vespula vulgaris]